MGTKLLLRKITHLTPGNILFLGDSITTTAMCEHGGYPTHTVELLNVRDGSGWAEMPIRIALGGRKTWEIADEIDAILLSASGVPDYVFLYSGANDGYPLSDEGDYTPINATWEESWKAAYAYIIEAIHTKYPDAKQFIGKTYRCSFYGEVEGWLPVYIFPWIDDLVATYPYLYAGINGVVILQGGFPESMTDAVHPNHLGCMLLAAGLRDEVF